MKQWHVDYSYSEPRWGDVEFPAHDIPREEVEAEARTFIEDMYPEALDIEITRVEEIEIG